MCFDWCSFDNRMGGPKPKLFWNWFLWNVPSTTTIGPRANDFFTSSRISSFEARLRDGGNLHRIEQCVASKEGAKRIHRGGRQSIRRQPPSSTTTDVTTDKDWKRKRANNWRTFLPRANHNGKRQAASLLAGIGVIVVIQWISTRTFGRLLQSNTIFELD